MNPGVTGEVVNESRATGTWVGRHVFGVWAENDGQYQLEELGPSPFSQE